jgi:hypothetical protein
MSPNPLDPERQDREDVASEIEAVADELVALVEEFEASISKGNVPPAFAKRLAHLRQTAERLIDP